MDFFFFLLIKYPVSLRRQIIYVKLDVNANADLKLKHTDYVLSDKCRVYKIIDYNKKPRPP